MLLARSVSAVLAITLAACASSTSQSDSTALDKEVQVPLGNQVSVASSALKVSLTSVPEDSRCPTHVVCVWEGNARVLLSATEGNGAPATFELNTTLNPKSADVLGYRITLLALTPVRAQPSDQIPANQYNAKLRIVRLPSQ